MNDNEKETKKELQMVRINGEDYKFYDFVSSETVGFIAREIDSDAYHISEIRFQSGDIVVDVGGNVGIFAIPLAKRFPFLKIFSFEPVKENFESFKKNIEVNGIDEGVITVINRGVTRDGRNITMIVDKRKSGNSVMAEIVEGTFMGLGRPQDVFNSTVESVTLSDIFKIFGIERCKLFKIDCEGCEFEVLNDVDTEFFDKIDCFRGEFHDQESLVNQGFSPATLFEKVKMKMKTKDVYVQLPS